MYTPGSELISATLPRVVDLTEDQLNEVAKLPMWTIYEACCFVLGKFPKDTPNTKNPDQNTGNEFAQQWVVLTQWIERARISYDLSYTSGPVIDGHSIIYFRPLDFVEWLVLCDLQCHEGLKNAVIQYHHERETRKKPDNIKSTTVTSAVSVDTNPPQSFPSDSSQVAPIPRYVFRKTIESWEIRFEDSHLNGVKHSLGIEYIQLLLQRPNQPISVEELLSYAGRENQQARELLTSLENSRGQIDGDNTDSSGDSNSQSGIDAGALDEPIIDAIAVRDYREELDQLNLELIMAEERKDEALQETIQSHIDFIQDELNRATGLHGRVRRLNSELDKNRKSVTAAIRRAIDNIRKLEEYQENTDSSIANYLDKAIITGSKCFYDAEKNSPAIEWLF